MERDISSRKDIHLIITQFYKRLLSDDKMSPFFKEFLENDSLNHHLDIITDFWEDILFNTYKYKNNPMQKHLDFQKKINFDKEHFSIWLSYLSKTINENFKGEVSETMKNRANSIAMVMQLKMNLH